MIARCDVVAVAAYNAQERARIKRFNALMSEPDFNYRGRSYWRSMDGKSVLSYRVDASGYYLPDTRLDFPAELVNGLHEALQHP